MVRLAQETNPSGGHFEGSVEEVDSGKELKFQSSTELLRFLGERFQAAFEEMPEDDCPITPENKQKTGSAIQESRTVACGFAEKEAITVQRRSTLAVLGRRSCEGDIMKLQVVWRNPQPPAVSKPLHSDADAEEAVQVAFLKAYQNLNRFQGNAKFSTWLIRIAMNESFMRLRKQRSNREQFLKSHSENPAEESSSRLPQHRLNLAD